jgi:hypothetical protein
MKTRISADEAHAARATHLRVGSDGRERLLKLASAPSTWNAGTRSARFVMTSQTVDRYGDIVVTNGVDTTEFGKNPVALLNHDSTDWPIGTWANVDKKTRTKPPRMEGDLMLHEADGPVETINQAAWMIERGYMRACSIGFIPDWNEVEKAVGADGEWKGGIQFNKAELLECSLCGIPANPQALAKGLFDGPNVAQETIEFVLDGWARGSDGGLMQRRAFEAMYQITKREDDSAELPVPLMNLLDEMEEKEALAVIERFLVAKGKAIVSRERIERIERAARAQRLAEQRKRDLDLIEIRGR